MKLIDTHNHLDLALFDEDRPQRLARCRSLGVVRQILIGVQEDWWARQWDTALAWPELYAALALHPCYMRDHAPDALARLRSWVTRLAEHPKLCALGEFGLDYFIEDADKAAQQRLFEGQLQLAEEVAKPALLHVRRAHAATVATLKRRKFTQGGIVHAFTGSYEEAREYIRLGFLIGLGGAGTWPQAKRMQRMLPRLPLEAIVLETDAPDISPSMHPVEPNSPEYLPDICTALADIMGVPADDLARHSTANACRLFGWDPEAL